MLVIVCLRQNTEVSVSHLREFVAVLLAVSFFFYEGVVDGRFKHCLFCFSALVLLVSSQCSSPSLCPLFTVAVTRPMEAQTKGGLFLLSYPGLSVPLWAQNLLRAGGCQRSTRGADLANLTARIREQKSKRETTTEG